MEPTPKSPGIEKLISKLTGKDRVETIKAGRCMTCDGVALQFKSELDAKEYTISGMCQECQDGVFGE